MLKMTKIFNRTDEKIKRRMLRGNMPPAEVILWSRLRNKGLHGYKFRRQHSVERFVIDFYCPQLKLAIEVDGDSHFGENSEIRDTERQVIMALRVLVWVNLYLLEHTGKDFQPKIIFIS